MAYLQLVLNSSKLLEGGVNGDKYTELDKAATNKKIYWKLTREMSNSTIFLLRYLKVSKWPGLPG